MYDEIEDEFYFIILPIKCSFNVELEKCIIKKFFLRGFDRPRRAPTRALPWIDPLES